jgi:cytochrome c oxidase subunit 3
MSVSTLVETTQRGYSRLAINRMGLWLFIASEAFLFLALISSRYLLLGLNRPAQLNQFLALIITSILLLSSLTAYRAETSIGFGDRAGLQRNLLLTIAMGLIFMVGVSFEWAEAFEFFPPSTLFGSVFFTLTGVHAAHVLSGVVLLALAYLSSRRGSYSADDHWGVEAIVKYWHFVDVAWVFIYPTLYLVG